MSREARELALQTAAMNAMATKIATSFSSVGVADQTVSTTDGPTFVTLTTTGAISGGSTITAATNLVATAGSVASGTTITAGTALVATTTVTAGTGITATTGNITATAGNLVATAGSISSGTTITAGTALIATTSVTAGTTITATLGNVTATDGDFVVTNVAKGYKVGANQVVGAQAATMAKVTMTVGGGALPVANGAVNFVDPTNPTPAELLEAAVELNAKLDTLLTKLKAHGLIAAA